MRTRTQNQDDLAPGANLPSRVMIQTLRDHYLPQSQNVIRLKEAALRQLKVGLHQPLVEAMVILTAAIGDVEAQGKQYTEAEKKNFFLSTVNNGEMVLNHYIQTIQLLGEQMSWNTN